MRLTLRFLLSAAPLAALPSQAVAAGMPQLNFKDPFLQGQVVWGAIIFFAFYLILSRSALPRVAGVLEERQKRIQNDLDIARKAKEDADRAYAERCAARKEASENAHARIHEIHQTAKADALAHAQETAQRLENDIRQAEERIAAQRETALAHLNEIALPTAVSLTERLLGQTNQEELKMAISRLHS